jgi:O-Antigen ligase
MTSTATLRALKSTAVGGEVLVLCWLLTTEGVSGIPLMIVTLLVAMAIIAISMRNWPFGAVLTLLIASAMPRFTWTVAGLHVRPEHLAIGLVAGILLLHYRRHSGARATWRAFDLWLLSYLGVNFVTSALTSPQPHLTLRWALLGALGVAPYFLIRWLVVEEETLVSVFRLLLVVGIAEAAYGTLSFFSYQLFNTRFGIELEQYGSMPGTYGTQYEANLFGSYTACCALMCLTGYLLDQKERRRWYLWGFSITMLGTFISLARAVFLAFPVAGAFVTWLAARKGRFQMRGLLALAGVLVAVLLLFGPVILQSLQDRFSTLSTSEIGEDETTARRLVGITVALSDVGAHPWLGTGTNSFRLLFDWADYWPLPQTIEGEEDERGAWIGNTPVRILHDTGIFGLTVFGGFLFTLLSALRRAVRIAPSSVRMIIVALASGLILYAITFQATDATTLSFAWIHIGLIATATTIVQRERRGSGSSQPALI